MKSSGAGQEGGKALRSSAAGMRTEERSGASRCFGSVVFAIAYPPFSSTDRTASRISS